MWKTTEVSLDEVELAIEPVEEEMSDRSDALARALAMLPVAQRSLLLAFYGEGKCAVPKTPGTRIL